MKFTEKYEILELLASGRVSTFLARQRTTQEQAIVHTFECPTAACVDPGTSAIIRHFAVLAPTPAEPVTDVGFDEGSSSAYVVTRVPAHDVMQSWVRAYRNFPEGQGKEVSGFDENATAELSASEVKRILGQSQPPKNPPPPESSSHASTEGIALNSSSIPSRQKGEFTRLFEDIGAFQPLSGSGAPRRSEPTPAQPAPPDQHDFPPTNYGAAISTTKANFDSPDFDSHEQRESEPGSFTQLFSGTDSLSVSADLAVGADLGDVAAPNQSAVKEPGSFTKEFLAISGKPTSDSSGSGAARMPPRNSVPPANFDSKPQSVPPPPKNPVEKFEAIPELPRSSTGEFTSFFRGPYEQPRPSDKPFEYPDPAEPTPPVSKAGDFTQMFGSETRVGQEQLPRMSPPAQEPPKSPSFTQIFSDNSKGGAKLGVSSPLDFDPLPPESLTPPMASTASPTPLPAMFSGTVSPSSSRAGSFSPSEPARVSGGESTFLHQSGRSDATNVFKPRVADAPLVEPESPSGPSEFTMFMDRSQLRAILPPEPPTGAAAGNAPGAPALPPMPPAPKIPSYAMPAPPAMPSAQMPAMAIPQPPAVPRPAVPAAGRAASYWPLIMVFTVLVAVAALLVMYFALKH